MVVLSQIDRPDFPSLGLNRLRKSQVGFRTKARQLLERLNQLYLLLLSSDGLRKCDQMLRESVLDWIRTATNRFGLWRGDTSSRF